MSYISVTGVVLAGCTLGMIHMSLGYGGPGEVPLGTGFQVAAPLADSKGKIPWAVVPSSIRCRCQLCLITTIYCHQF